MDTENDRDEARKAEIARLDKEIADCLEGFVGQYVVGVATLKLLSEALSRVVFGTEAPAWLAFTAGHNGRVEPMNLPTALVLAGYAHRGMSMEDLRSPPFTSRSAGRRQLTPGRLSR